MKSVIFPNPSSSVFLFFLVFLWMHSSAFVMNYTPVVKSAKENAPEIKQNSKWQIDDYVEYLLGETIAPNTDGLNYDEGINWYYQVLDVKGGFASITGPIEGWQEFVVWRMANGNDLVAQMTVGCGPACDYSFKFYTGKNDGIGAIEEAKVLPVEAIEAHRKKMLPQIIAKYPVDYPEDSQVVYNLPQKGTGMVVDLSVGADEVMVPLLKLGWNKSKFFVETLFEKVEAKGG